MDEIFAETKYAAKDAADRKMAIATYCCRRCKRVERKGKPIPWNPIRRGPRVKKSFLLKGERSLREERRKEKTADSTKDAVSTEQSQEE